jgi:phage/plasmid-associated DNA primase
MVSDLNRIETRPHEAASIRGKGLVIFSEASSTGGVSKLKNIITGDTMVAEVKHKQPEIFKPKCLVLFTSNEI